MKSLLTCLLFALATAGLVGCDNLGDTLSDVDSPTLSESPSSNFRHEGPSKTILGYEVEFKSRLVDEHGTTFSYRVTRPSSSPPALSFFFIESPDCVGSPVALQPTSSVNYPSVVNGLNGIRWTATGMQPGSTSTYSVTYAGDVPLGRISVVLAHSSATESDEVLGACKGIPNLVNISGSVFVDADEDGDLDPGAETGIGNVTVQLLDGAGNSVADVITEEDGSYLFQVAAGTYSVSVPMQTSSTTDFNESLYDYFDPTGITSTPPNQIEQNVADLNFGFLPDVDELSADLKSGTITTAARKASWWAGEFRSAVSGKGNPQFSKEDLGLFLGEVELLLLPEVFQFDDLDPLGHASLILNRPLRTDQDQLEQALLAAELNFLAGLGSGSPELDLAMFAFAESDWVVRFGGALGRGGADAVGKTSLSSTTLLAAYNDSGTGTGSGRGTLKRGGDE